MPPLLLAPSRIWITAEPHPQFPIGLLQMGIKITNEAPVGMKAGLRASYQWVNQDMLDAVSRFEWRQLLFAMCFLHSVVQERRKFGPIGWNVPYEFNASDLSACTQFLQVRRDPGGEGGQPWRGLALQGMLVDRCGLRRVARVSSSHGTACGEHVPHGGGGGLCKCSSLC
jgi:hypothetical protein